MEWYGWMILIGVWLFASGFLSWALISFLEGRQNRSSLEEFTQDLVAAIKHSQPNWGQVLDIAETSQVNVKSAYEVSRKLYRDILTGKDPNLEEHRKLVESYIAKHKEAEPFEGLPTETRVHLERLREALAGNEHILDPLTMQIRELVSIYEKDTRAQKRYAIWGFVVGLLGLFLAGYAFLDANSAGGNVPRSEPTESVEGSSVEVGPSEVQEAPQ